MSVRLIAITKPAIVECQEAGDLLAYCARVSNPANQANTDTAPRLLAYLVRNQHWSPFEMASMTVEIVTTRAIAAFKAAGRPAEGATHDRRHDAAPHHGTTAAAGPSGRGTGGPRASRSSRSTSAIALTSAAC